MRIVLKFARYLILFIFSGTLFFACKTSRIISDSNLKSLNTSKIIENIEHNALDYKYLTIRRINCQYQDNNGKASFRANVKTLKNEAIVVSFNKLNIPFGRIYLTPDSVKYINYIDKNYFIGDYNFLKEIFNIDIGFNDIQSIINNNIFSYRNSSNNNNFRNFTSYIDSGMYVLQSVNNRKLNKIENKDKIQKAERMIKRFNDEAFILQTIFIAPGSFNINKIRIEDKSNNQLAEFEFDDYVDLENKDYPGEIIMNFSSEQSNINMRTRLAGFSTDKIEKLSFNIPQRFQRLTLQ